jgi:hypothetical protein
MEAVPTDAANIKARGFGLKTVGDLAQYYRDITPVINKAKALARQKKVVARKQSVAHTDTGSVGMQPER